MCLNRVSKLSKIPYIFPSIFKYSASIFTKCAQGLTAKRNSSSCCHRWGSAISAITGNFSEKTEGTVVFSKFCNVHIKKTLIAKEVKLASLTFLKCYSEDNERCRSSVAVQERSPYLFLLYPFPYLFPCIPPIREAIFILRLVLDKR